jgi:lipoprotein-anchoring transpeptidase ErfK/SrfK
VFHSRPTPARIALALLLSAGLAACAPDPKLIEAGLAQAPAPKLIEGVYGAQKDGAFNVAAVPVDKVPVPFQRQSVYYPSPEAEGTVIIDPGQKHLYLITGRNQALRYGISVGREGFQWAGTAVISSRQSWPTWTPPPEMIERKPELIKWEKGQPGGPDNPLGARALYLTTNGVDYGYRIHGTPEWYSIGKNASSGCFRMINQDVIDLFTRVKDGAKVVVLNADGSYPKRLNLPPPPPKKADAVTVTALPGAAAGDGGEMVLNPALLPAAAVKPKLVTLPVPKF